MRTLMTSLGMLFGILLCVSGLVAALVTQLDPVVGSIGLVVAFGGGTLSWACRRYAGAHAPDADGSPRRSLPPDKPGGSAARRQDPKKRL